MQKKEKKNRLSRTPNTNIDFNKEFKLEPILVIMLVLGLNYFRKMTLFLAFSRVRPRL